MTETMYDLSERVALVTGAGQNVGAGIAHALARQGAQVLVNDIVQERAEEVVHQITLSGGTARAVLFDVTNLDSVLTALAPTGPIDILVNNAGNAGSERMQPRPFVEMDPEAWESPIRVNLYGVLHCCHAVVPGMCARGRGRVVTISSGAATAGVNIGVAPYSAGKGGAIAFTRSLALEVARAGVTANSLAIGLMENPGSTNDRAVGPIDTRRPCRHSRRCGRRVRMAGIGRSCMGDRGKRFKSMAVRLPPDCSRH